MISLANHHVVAGGVASGTRMDIFDEIYFESLQSIEMLPLKRSSVARSVLSAGNWASLTHVHGLCESPASGRPLVAQGPSHATSSTTTSHQPADVAVLSRSLRLDRGLVNQASALMLSVRPFVIFRQLISAGMPGRSVSGTSSRIFFDARVF